MSTPIRTWTTREELVHQAVTLARQGMSRRAIARTCGVSRNTVKVILATHAEERDEEHSALPDPPRLLRVSKLDRFKDRIIELLGKYSDITAQRVFEILRDDGFEGSYSTVKVRLRTLRPASKPEPSRVAPEYGPGEMAENDWSPYSITFTTGDRTEIQAFSYVLVYSKRKFYGIFERNDLHALMDGHVLSFARFEGCARHCKYDSQKPVVQRWEGRQPIYNLRFLAFATYYEFRPVAVLGNPNAKPRVERSFWEFETSFLNGRSFHDLDDMKAQLAHWLDTIVDHRVRHRRTPLDRFAEERDQLVPLPRHPYDTARVVYRVCSIDGFVDWEGNRYAIPYDHVTDILPVRITQHELFVYAADLRCIARHELAPRGGGHKLDPHGYHPPPRGHGPVDLDQLRVAFDQMGQGAHDFFLLACTSPVRQWVHQLRQVLVLRQRYDTADLDAALAHAALYGAFQSQAVERILAARSKPRTLDEYVAEDTARRLAETLGESRTAPRDLGEYDRLPLCGTCTSRATSAPSQETTSCPSETTPVTLPATEATDPLLPPTTSSANDSNDISRSSD